MLNLSGISNFNNNNQNQQHQRRSSGVASSSAAPSVVGGGNNNTNNNNNNPDHTQLPPVYGNNSNVTQHHHQQQQNFYQSNTTNNNTNEIIGGGNSTEIVFEDEVPVHLRNMDREEVVQSLGVCVQVIKNGPFRTVHLRVTDPKDPFFLYTMALAEDDYGRFKDKNELHVDFGGFPRDLVQMLVASKNNNTGDNSTHQQHNTTTATNHHNHNHNSAVDMSTVSTAANSAMLHTVLSFVIANGNDSQATLRILEKTAFRSVEHLSLIMTKQGDVGQKQYLAERFRYFLRAFQMSENNRANENDHFSKQVSELSIALEQLRAERDQLRQQNALQASEHKAELASAIDRLRSSSEEHSRSAQSDHETQLASLNRQHHQEQQRNQNEIDNLQARLQQSAQKIQELEAERLRLSTDLAQKTESLSASIQDANRLREKVDELSSFKKSAIREKNELDMAAVASTERLKHMAELLKNRDEEVSQLRRLGDSNEAALRRANEQLDATRKKLDETEQSLAKSHHIIATQLQAQKTFKEKEKALQAQVKSAEKTAQDKTMEYERVKLETAADREKTATLTSRVAELKEQLKRAEDQNTNLANDLKQSQEALLHLGRSSSASGAGLAGSLGAGGGSGRMYTSMMSAHGASSRAAAYSSSNNLSSATASGNNENAAPSNGQQQQQPGLTSSGSGTGGNNFATSGLSSSTFAPAPITLFREFAKGNNNSGSGVGANNSSSGMPLPVSGGGYASKYLNSSASAYATTTRPSSTATASGSSQSNINSSSANLRDPMSMLRNTAAGGSNTNAAPVTSAYFPSTA